MLSRVKMNCAEITKDRPRQPAYEIFNIEHTFQPSEFQPSRFKKFFVQRPQILLLFHEALLLYCTLHTDCLVTGSMLSRVT